MDLSLGKLMVFVPDLQVADAFYEGTLGLERVSGGEDFRSLRGPDFELVLFRCEDATDPEGYAQRAGSAITFGVPDIAAAMQHLRDHDVRLLHAEPQPGDDCVYVAFVDPFGTVHEIVEYGRAD